MTVLEALNLVQHRSVSRRDAEVFLQHILQIERAELHTHDERELTPEQEEHYLKCLDRREQNEPVAYITGWKEFYGRRFACDHRALIPRPETELLIDRALALAPGIFSENLNTTGKPCPVRVLELGTGVGNIAATLCFELAKQQTPAQIIATDVVVEAVQLAQENLERLSEVPGEQTSPTTLLIADMFDHPSIAKGAPYDLIVANLPYVPIGWKTDSAAQPDVVFWEPDIALFGGEDGLDHYRVFFDQVWEYLAPEGVILIEYGEDETGDLRFLLDGMQETLELTVHKDYAELDRMLEIRRKK